jgi:hypothetical protein
MCKRQGMLLRERQEAKIKLQADDGRKDFEKGYFEIELRMIQKKTFRKNVHGSNTRSLG